ncbi:hypothetical protein M2232_009253 [Bradyrhizobium japonicum]|uniref:helix-turn-helix domain-containing protein n=1 Tax=Bradyrhizobium japonicum TaxID=375 RepID=UPI002225BB24|nr:helix-turn-helix domain-containing protein [Bradyrhizobium japonicum]MCW2225721.1 hypothetical protein [Bradyrhizobium japonicum]MCW2340933.1 hypothetical protein [Bradyrhizobium japonicum]
MCIIGRAKRGRPSIYFPEYADQAAKLFRLGATDAEIADFFGKHERTINRWKTDQLGFCQALKDGKLISDMDWPTGCASAPLASNTRRPRPHKLKPVEYKDGKRLKETDRLEIVMVKRVLPPDTTACIFWLKSRRKVEWRE